MTSPFETLGTGTRSLFRGNPWNIAIGIVVILGIWLVFAYNGLVSASANVKNMWAQVEVQYQRRVDLVPNLVATVKGAANFEQETFRQVTEARSAWAQAKTVGDRGQEIAAAGSFDAALSRLIVTVEAYPQLQATQSFRDLMTQLEGTENRVSVARKDYNDAVAAYNIRVMRFPGKLAAVLFGFTSEKPFEAAPGSENAPAVDFTK